MPRYAKGPPPPRRQTATPPSTMVVRVTLGNMPLQDAYEVSAPQVAPDQTLGALLDRLFPFPSSTHVDEEVLSSSEADPDAAAMHAEVSRMIHDSQATRCALTYFVNHGPEIDPSDLVAPHLRESGADTDQRRLDLVIEQRFTPLEYAVARGNWPGVPELVEWLEDCTVLVSTDGGGASGSEEATNRLVEQGLLEYVALSGPKAITEAGRARLQELVAEAAAYDGRYGIFEDVLYDDEAQVADFGTGLGQDFRPLVYEAEGIDPVRAIFLVRSLGSTDDTADTRSPEHPFTALLTPAVDRPLLGDADLEQIIEAGLALVEADAEARQRDITRRQAVRHARRQTRGQGGQAQV